MKVVYTDEALKDLTDIANWLAAHYPGLGSAVERRIRIVVAHIARWPESARPPRRPNGRVFASYPSVDIRIRYSTV